MTIVTFAKEASPDAFDEYNFLSTDPFVRTCNMLVERFAANDQCPDSAGLHNFADKIVLAIENEDPIGFVTLSEVDGIMAITYFVTDEIKVQISGLDPDDVKKRLLISTLKNVPEGNSIKVASKVAEYLGESFLAEFGATKSVGYYTLPSLGNSKSLK